MPPVAAITPSLKPCVARIMAGLVSEQHHEKRAEVRPTA